MHKIIERTGMLYKPEGMRATRNEVTEVFRRVGTDYVKTCGLGLRSFGALENGGVHRRDEELAGQLIVVSSASRNEKG